MHLTRLTLGCGNRSSESVISAASICIGLFCSLEAKHCLPLRCLAERPSVPDCPKKPHLYSMEVFCFQS